MNRVTSNKQTVDNPPPPPVGWLVSQSIYQLPPKVWCPRLDLFDSNPYVGWSFGGHSTSDCSLCVTQYIII